MHLIMDKIVTLAHSWANVYLTTSVIANVQYSRHPSLLEILLITEI